MTGSMTSSPHLSAGRFDESKTEEILRPTLHHVQVTTTRLDEMIEWYQTVTGMEIMHRGSGAAWLTNDRAGHRFAVVTGDLTEDPDKLSHTGLHHSAYEYGALDELLSTYVRLKRLDILPHRTVNHGMTTSFYYVDPDGNSVELQADNFGDWDMAREFMRSPEFAADPFGPGVDPEKLLAARRAGMDAEEINRRSYAGEFPNVRPNELRR
jgi:catechol 2,3-dioxygenase